MKLLIFYDIVETRNRNNIVYTLESYSFYRVQKSVFMGNINENKYKTFQIELSRQVAATDLLYIVPLSEYSFKNIMTLGHSIYPELLILKRNEFDFKDIVIWKIRA